MPFDSETQVELLVLFQQYLGKDPKYLEVAAKLKEALETNQVNLIISERYMLKEIF